MRNMSFALTEDQVLHRSKTVTRRLGWKHLKPGDLIQPVQKCMGLKRGEQVIKLGDAIRVVSVKREPLNELSMNPLYGLRECRLEGFPAMGPSDFIAMFCAANKCTPVIEVTRIEFEYT